MKLYKFYAKDYQRLYGHARSYLRSQGLWADFMAWKRKELRK